MTVPVEHSSGLRLDRTQPDHGKAPAPPPLVSRNRPPAAASNSVRRRGSGTPTGSYRPPAASEASGLDPAVPSRHLLESMTNRGTNATLKSGDPFSCREALTGVRWH